jgi:hypothetical protein
MGDSIDEFERAIEKALASWDIAIKDIFDVATAFTGIVQDFKQQIDNLGTGAADPSDGASLRLFYTSQWDSPKTISWDEDGKPGGSVVAIKVDANARRGDCGPAALAPVVYYYTRNRSTVDEIGDVCGQPREGEGSLYTSRTQLIYGGNHLLRGSGFRLISAASSRTNILTPAYIMSEIDEGRPVLALINYGTLREFTDPVPSLVKNQDRKYSDGHWVAVVGYGDDDELGIVFEIMDPDFWGDRREDGDHRIVTFQALDEALRTVSDTRGNSVNYQGIVVRRAS